MKQTPTWVPTHLFPSELPPMFPTELTAAEKKLAKKMKQLLEEIDAETEKLKAKKKIKKKKKKAPPKKRKPKVEPPPKHDDTLYEREV
ncbi:MAG: hypothetical protein WA766_11460 [Candidatus Acidiferrales bacterium]